MFGNHSELQPLGITTYKLSSNWPKELSFTFLFIRPDINEKLLTRA